MKISLDWLKDYIDVDRSVEDVVEILDNIGLLVDGREEIQGEVVLDLETYANRPDTLGHVGVARELAAVSGQTLKEPNWPLTEHSEKTENCVDVQIWDEDLCPRYSGIVVKGIRVEPSPEWLQKRIRTMGLKPVNNVVDITNFVLFSTAQPIHAFDLSKLSGSKIIVRRAKKGESLKDLEGRVLEFTTDTLVIADDKNPVALAGVIGGLDSAVSSTTGDVFIESAYFNPVSIRKTAKKAGIQTDASYRFERGADIAFPPSAALMAASLLCQMGGKVTKGVIDVYPKPRKIQTVILRHHRISELLGVDIPPAFVTRILSSLNFVLTETHPKIWQVKPPSFRVDIEREADLIEEIARFYGYDKIPSRVPSYEVLDFLKDEKKRGINRLREVLFHEGFTEVVNFSFADPDKEAGLSSSRERIQILNPISSRASILRTSLLGSLLENISWNRNRGVGDIHIFELGEIYFFEGDSPREKFTLGMATTGLWGVDHFQEKARETDFLLVKGVLESMMHHLRYTPFSFQPREHICFRRETSLALQYKGQDIGVAGQISEETLRAFDINQPVWAAEISLDLLLGMQPRPFQYTPVIKYPSVIRDMTFLADASVRFQKIQDVLGKLKLPYLERYYLYDRFKGQTVPKGKVSLSFRFIFRHPQRTLLAEEVDSFQKKIIESLGAEFRFTLREGG